MTILQSCTQPDAPLFYIFQTQHIFRSVLISYRRFSLSVCFFPSLNETSGPMCAKYSPFLLLQIRPAADIYVEDASGRSKKKVMLLFHFVHN